MKGEELSVCRQEELDAVLTRFESVFSDDPGFTGTVKHTISTTTETPIHSHPYRLCPKWRDQVRNELDSLLRSGIIKESTSPWASPIVPVRKSDGSLRLCVDFRKLNGITNPDPFYMPLVEEIIDQLGEATFLSKVDLSKGFYQIAVNPEDTLKMAFLTPFGK